MGLYDGQSWVPFAAFASSRWSAVENREMSIRANPALLYTVARDALRNASVEPVRG